MARVVLSIPKLGVTEKGWEVNKEIYVLSFCADLNPPTGAKKTPEVIAAYNETLPLVAPAAMAMSGMQFVLTAVSNIFTRVRADQPVSLSGSGILLYPNLDPMGMLANHFVIVESDEGTRNLGKVLDGILSDAEVSKAVNALLAAAITQPLLAGLMGALVSRIPAILKKNKDDVLFAHSHSGFDFDGYGGNGNGPVTDYELGNDLASCTLRVRVG